MEGLDVDKEYHFDKFLVRSEIADLFMRIWNHPNGEAKHIFCKELETGKISSIVSKFAVTISESLGYLLDDACDGITFLASMTTKKGTMSRSEQQSFSHQSDMSSHYLLITRKMLRLICTIAKEPACSSFLGRAQNGTGDHFKSLANMIVYFLDKLTNANGGTHSDLDFSTPPTNLGNIDMTVMQKKARGMVAARSIARLEYGFDVSSLSHQLIALVSRNFISTNVQRYIK